MKWEQATTRFLFSSPLHGPRFGSCLPLTYASPPLSCPDPDRHHQVRRRPPGRPWGNALRVDARPLRNPPEDPAVRARMLHANGLRPQYETTFWPHLEPAGSSNAASTAPWRSWLCPTRSAWTSMSCAAAGTGLLSWPRNSLLWYGASDTARDRAQAHRSAHPHLATTHRPRARLLRLLARGHAHTQIAAMLSVSRKTAGRLLYGPAPPSVP